MKMYRVTKGKTNDLPDVGDFIDLLNNLDQHSIPELRGLLDPQQELVVTRAPGRLDVMGGIADYSGSMVLELPIREATFVGLQLDPDPQLRVISLSEDANHHPVFEMSLNDFTYAGEAVDYDRARGWFQSDSARRWAAYVGGVFLVLMRERHIRFSRGARILISSSVPVGKGVSSSAALEVSVMQAVAAGFSIELQPRELAMLCQKVENLVVGAPCGIMDQMTSACGEANRLLAMICQPAELQEMVPIPDDIVFWGVDSGIRHSVAGEDYGSVRTGAFMGYRIIAELAKLNIKASNRGARCEVDDPRWGGYLANISPAEFERHYLSQLPERLSGAAFLTRYKATTDPVTLVDTEGVYAVRMPTSHPIYENQRVREFARLLCAHPSSALAEKSGFQGGTTSHTHVAVDERLKLLGELMYQSHESYSACGLNSEGTDLLVNLVREAGPGAGLYGAKITGGGSGGTVAILGNRSAKAGIASVCEQYTIETGRPVHVFCGSSPGSAAFGHLRLANDPLN